ncbi:MAG: M23 family metallopeptidase [Chloroflexi bacterium]|nr:M23 family metallopeptidase [Chloroflexota bacterium]
MPTADRRPTTVNRQLITVHCILITILLTSCGQSPISALPTLIPAVFAPETAEEVGTPTAVPTRDAALRIGNPHETAVPIIIPTPDSAGLRPENAQQKYLPDAGPAPAEDWRPPPYDVPLSLHPDDHYWLVRPIATDSRNYDLEWYPFGNDVLAAGLPPYRIHHGLDFPNEQGTPVLAAGSGKVIHTGAFPSPRNGVNYYGNTVVIQHDWQWAGQDVFTLYAHTLELFVEEGDHVEAGQLIAGVGSSGEVTGPHLHFEVRVGGNNYGDAQNPDLWLAPYEGWGTIAGRFIDRRGRLISSALLELRPLDAPLDSPLRKQRTYYPTVKSDSVWGENFVFDDLPAGTYELLLDANDGIHRYKRELTVYPGQTTFETIATNFDFFATATPIPTQEPTLTPQTPIFLDATPEG